jgi:cyclopropane fatty-acyl-phospholipid synthase-like methyltransferase
MSESGLYEDPELYDLLFPAARDITSARDEARRQVMIASEQFYLEEASKRGGRVLELGCGSGRLTVLMAQNGIDIVGVDLSEPMLDAARGKARAEGVDVQFVRADMRYLDLTGQFATILIPGNSLLHLLTVEELKQCLAGVRSHLAPGGRLVFDISKWDMSRYTRDPDRRYPAFTLEHPSAGEITVEEMAGYDAAAQVRHVVWYVSTAAARDLRRIEYQLRVIFPQELLLLLETAGFRLEARYGELTRAPFDASSPRQVCVCAI